MVRVRLGSALTVPIRSWLLGESGQRGKLWVARQLIDAVRGHIKDVRLLINAWLMRSGLILAMLEQQFGSSERRDGVRPCISPGTGAKSAGDGNAKYDQRIIDAALVDVLPARQMELTL